MMSFSLRQNIYHLWAEIVEKPAPDYTHETCSAESTVRLSLSLTHRYKHCHAFVPKQTYMIAVDYVVPAEIYGVKHACMFAREHFSTKIRYTLSWSALSLCFEWTCA